MELTKKKQQQDYIWYVSCPGHGRRRSGRRTSWGPSWRPAREWELRWTVIAAACDVVRMRKAVD